MTESEQRFKIKTQSDVYYVNITFKIKYKLKHIYGKTNHDIVLDGYTTVENVVLKKYRNIDKILSDFIRQQPTFLNRITYYYLKRNKKIIKSIDKTLKASQIGIRNKDEIIIIDDMEKKRELDEQIRLNEMKQNNLLLKDNKGINNILNDDFDHILKSYLKIRIKQEEFNFIKEEKNKRDKKIKIMKGIFLFLIICLIALGIYFVIRFLKPPKTRFIDEDLVLDINYRPDILYRYKYRKQILTKFEGNSVNKDNSTREIILEGDILFIIKEENTEFNQETYIKKQWYNGYLSIMNLSLINETGVTEIIYNKYLYDALEQRNHTKNEDKKKDEKIINSSVVNTTFAKIDFYQNGTIKNISYPKEDFSLENMVFLKEIINLLIPKLSPSLYTKNITETLEKMEQENNETSDDSDTDDDIYDDIFDNDTDDDDIYDDDIFDNDTDDDDIFDNDIYDDDDIFDNDTDDDDIFDNDIYDDLDDDIFDNDIYDDLDDDDEIDNRHETDDVYVNDDINLRNTIEKDNKLKKGKIFYVRGLMSDDQSEIYQIEEYLTPSSLDENINLREKNKCNNCSEPNLTQYSSENIGTDEADLDNSKINKTIYTTIKNGILESVIERENAVLLTPEDEDDLADIQFKQDTFNEFNQLSSEDVKDDFKYNISFGLDGLYFDTINQINLTENFKNYIISKALFEYYDNFTYETFDEAYYNEYIYSLIDEKLSKENNISYSSSNEKIDNLRRNENLDSTYYGMKKIINEKDLYNYNLLGLKMKKQTFNEMNPSSGIMTTYFIMTFGNVNRKIKTTEQRTNLHIILKNKNQMIFNLMQLLDISNKDLEKRNKNITEMIINMESNLIEMIKPYDFSDILRDCLSQLNSKLANFTGDIFNNLIDLINKVYINYTIILDDVENNKYEIFSKIREITKKEYINYINEMINNLGNFTDATLLFLDKIEEEVENITKFEKIDFLYDILDNIYECKLLLNQFSKNLFKAIEKGILSFKADIFDFKELIIGDLLYITDFLSININKNSILIKSLDEKTRKDLTFKLRSFGDIVKLILDLLISNINYDYKMEMSLDNIDSIKYDVNLKSKDYLEQIEEKSNSTIEKIKEKIDYIKLYELYTENLDMINNIHNKTIIELIYTLNQDFITKVINFKPEYLNKNSDIYIKKSNLFNISKLIVEELNKEINEINKYIKVFSNNYKEKNIYNMQYNLYKINNLFLENETDFLLNQLEYEFKHTIQMHLDRIDYNYKLAMDYLNELKRSLKGRDWNAWIGKGFFKRYQNFIVKFTKYVSSSNSDVIYNNLEYNFFKIRDKIYNFMRTKILSINTYYFKNEIYQENFFFINRINLELNSIIEKINKSFNKERFSLFKALLLKNSLNTIKKYNDKKNNKMVDLYNSIFKKSNGLYDSNKDYIYKKRTFWTWLTKRYKTKKYYCSLHDNINKVKLDIKHTTKYLTHSTKLIYNNFINKIDKYISNYINITQKLYDNLHIYVESKINNNNNIKMLFDKYEEEYHSIININSNYGILKQLYNKINKDKDDYINIIQNNIKFLTDEYYNNYYLKHNEKFLEYPKEILYKVRQYQNELNNNLDKTINKINIIYRNRITNIISSTNIFIKDLVNNDYKFILVNVKNKDIMKEFIDSKTKFISNQFNNYLNYLYEISSKIYDLKEQNSFLKINNEKDFIFTESNFYSPISNTLQNLESFILNLEDSINKTFIKEICENIDDNNITNSTIDIYFNNPIYNDNKNTNITNNTICYNIKYSSDLENYEYNFNVVKIRSGLFYTKTSLENIMNIYDELNYTELFNIELYNNNENLLNDKNIFNIYNSTLLFLKKNNEESKLLLKEQDEYLYENIMDYYYLQNDYYPYLKKYEKILKIEDIKFNNYYKKFIQSKLDEILTIFNETLYKQKGEYMIYNIDKNNLFNNDYIDYYNKIKYSFEILKNNILGLNKNYIFLNSFRNHMLNKQKLKINYYNNLINELSKKHDFNLLNMTLDIGDIIANFLQSDYNEEEFSYLLEYVKISDLYINNFISYLNEIAFEIEKNILNKFSNIFKQFLKEFNNDISTYINHEYINELKKNYTNCLNYSIDQLEQTLKEDEINYKKYLEYLNYTEYISNNSNINISNISETEEIKEIKEMIFVNKTEILLNCDINNYYNYSVKLYVDFEEQYKYILNDLINKIININSNDSIEFLLCNYFENNDEYELENNILVEYLIEDIEYNLINYDDMILYINYTQNNKYNNYLYDLLEKSFKPSYKDYINNYLINPLIDNITIFINDYTEIHLDYLINKITDEFDYYVLLLKNTKELGRNSINSIISLYDDVGKKLNQSINYTVNEYVLFYLDLFYRNNKYIFSENYISYYSHALNEYKNELLYNLNEIIDEIIYDGIFYKKTKEYSNELMRELVVSKMYNAIKFFIDNKFLEIYSKIEDFKIKIIDIISNIEQNEDNQNINKIINNYKIVLLQQNNQFIFKVSDIPFNELYSFLKDVLEPPILEIKREYNIIEEEILGEIQPIFETFPSLKDVIKGKLEIENIVEYIKFIFEKMKDSLLKYQVDLNEDYDSYINKLIHYTYINGLDSYDKPCNNSYCAIKVSKFKNKQRRRLKSISNKNYSKRRNNQLNINLTAINERRNKNIDIRKLTDLFDSTMGSLSINDVIPLLLDIKETIYDLNKSYINNFDIKVKEKTFNFINKVNVIYMVRLNRAIQTSLAQFSHILSKEYLQKFSNGIYKEYYKLEDYLAKATNYLQENIDKLTLKLIKSSDFIGEINYISYNKIIAYFNNLKELIESKYQMMVNNNKKEDGRRLNQPIYQREFDKTKSDVNEEGEDDDEYERIYDIDDDDELARQFNSRYRDNYINNENIFENTLDITEGAIIRTEGELVEFFEYKNETEKEDNNNEKEDNNNEKEDNNNEKDDKGDLTSELSNVLDKYGFKSLSGNVLIELNLLKISIPIPPFIFCFPPFPFLQVRIVPDVSCDLIFKFGTSIDPNTDEDYSVFFDISGNAEVSVSYEIGIFIPPFPSPMEMSLSVGIRGLLASASIGIKLSLFIKDESKIEIELYKEFKTCQFTFYILFNFQFNFGIFKFSFKFYLMNESIGEIGYKIKKIVNYLKGKFNRKQALN